MNHRAACILVLIALAVSVRAGALDDRGAHYSYVRHQLEVKHDRFIENVATRLVIDNKRGADYRMVGISKSPFAKLKKIKAVVYDRNGRKIYDRDRKDLLQAKGYGASFELYNDMEIFQTECLPPSYPYTIDFFYELEYESLFFWRGASVQRAVPVDTFLYTMKIKNDLPFAMQCPDLLPPATVATDGDWDVHTWTAVSVPAFDFDNYIPKLNEPATLKLVSHQFDLDGHSFDSLTWKNVGLWYNSLAADRYLPVDDSPVLASATPDQRPTARDIYNRLISDTRYVCVSIGLSGWQPAEASATEKCNYGDCKGLSTLLISRLRNAGIEAYPVLVLTRSQGRIDPDFPEFGFNHLITVAVVDNDTVWMDPTCSTCEYGNLPPDDEDIPVLIATDTGGVLVRTPASSGYDNRIVNRTSVTFGPDGLPMFVSTVAFYGNSAQSIRSFYPHLERGDITDFLQNLLDTGLRARLISHDVAGLNDLDSTLEIRIGLTANQPYAKYGDCSMVFPPLIARSVERTLQRKSHVEFGIDLGSPRLVFDSVTVEWTPDSAINVQAIPDEDSLSSTFGSAHRTADRTESMIRFNYARGHERYWVAADEIDAFREFCDRIAKLKAQGVGICGL